MTLFLITNSFLKMPLLLKRLVFVLTFLNKEVFSKHQFFQLSLLIIISEGICQQFK